MKAIIQAYSPEELERIARGEQTVKVCKTAPKEVPFKVYMYMTHKGNKFIQKMKTTKGYDAYVEINYKIAGKVVGEFMCNRVDEFQCCCLPFVDSDILGYRRFLDNGVYKLNEKDTDGIVFERQDRYIDSMLKNDDLREMQLSPQELFDYIGLGKKGYALHISDLKIYDDPKELGEFRTVKCTNKKGSCSDCKIKPDCIKYLTRPPQSWQYVIVDR